MKILITGANGQLGRDCQAALQPNHAVIATDLPEFDVTDGGQVHRQIAAHRPEVILNCAAFTRVDDCETKKDLAFRANAEAPNFLAQAARATNARLVHLSTDYVFDGMRTPPQPYTEDDAPRPVSVYGASKLAGEEAVRASGARFAIVRTAWLYGRYGGNFPKTMLRLALQQPERELRVINEQWGSPTWSWRLAEQIKVVIETRAEGLFHATAEGCTTWHGFATAFLQAMNVPHRLVPCRTVDYPTPARRPGNSILDNRQLKAAGWNVMRPWAADVAEFVARYRDELLEEARSAWATAVPHR
ncbi:MAG: dTDP-4-dehydrorhamnose reductase [Verrucomicrobia bacterium]|nr:MAG: dTDP-4-dehydrorhamnose reductase [Verrucomicrobiota bacterium]